MYVKSGIDGKPIINLSSNGIIEPIGNDDASIPNIDSMTITVDNVNDLQENVIIIGKVNSNPRLSEFNNIRGELSKSLQMQISNKANTRSLRVVIWNVDETKIPKVFNVGINVRLIGPGSSPVIRNMAMEILKSMVTKERLRNFLDPEKSKLFL